MALPAGDGSYAKLESSISTAVRLSQVQHDKLTCGGIREKEVFTKAMLWNMLNAIPFYKFGKASRVGEVVGETVKLAGRVADARAATKVSMLQRVKRLASKGKDGLRALGDVIAEGAEAVKDKGATAKALGKKVRYKGCPCCHARESLASKLGAGRLWSCTVGGRAQGCATWALWLVTLRDLCAQVKSGASKVKSWWERKPKVRPFNSSQAARLRMCLSCSSTRTWRPGLHRHLFCPAHVAPQANPDDNLARFTIVDEDAHDVPRKVWRGLLGPCSGGPAHAMSRIITQPPLPPSKCIVFALSRLQLNLDRLLSRSDVEDMEQTPREEEEFVSALQSVFKKSADNTKAKADPDEALQGQLEELDDFDVEDLVMGRGEGAEWRGRLEEAERRDARGGNERQANADFSPSCFVWRLPTSGSASRW